MRSPFSLCSEIFSSKFSVRLKIMHVPDDQMAPSQSGWEPKFRNIRHKICKKIFVRKIFGQKTSFGTNFFVFKKERFQKCFYAFLNFSSLLDQKLFDQKKFEYFFLIPICFLSQKYFLSHEYFWTTQLFLAHNYF